MPESIIVSSDKGCDCPSLTVFTDAVTMIAYSSLPHSLTRTSLVWFFIITGLLLFCGASASTSVSTSRHQLLFPCVIDTALCICRPFAESPQVLHRQQTLSLRWWNSPCLNAFTHTVGYAVSCDPASFRRQSDLIYNLNGIKTEIN